jgi:hypothetical protein
MMLTPSRFLEELDEDLYEEFHLKRSWLRQLNISLPPESDLQPPCALLQALPGLFAFP